jgi:hypothetical protein
MGQELCYCNDTIEKNQNNQTYNYYPLERLFPYEDVINDLDYMIISGNNFYDNSFARDLTFTVSHHSNATFYSFETVNFNEPIKITNRDSSFVLNLTPCKENSRLYSIQTSLYMESPTRGRGEGFDSSAYSYFTLFMDVFEGVTGSGQYIGFEVYRSFLHNKYDYHSLDSLNDFIREINKSQNLTLSVVDPEIDGDHYLDYGSNDYYVGELIREIEEIEDFDFVDYLFTKFVSSTTDMTKINETVEKKLDDFLSPYLHDKINIPSNFSTISLINRYLEDRYTVSFSTSKMNYELTPLILRAWDEKNNRPINDSVGNNIAREISMCFNTELHFNLNKTNDRKYTFQNCQLKPSEIYKTGVTVSIYDVSGEIYLNERVEHSWKWDIMEFFKNDSISSKNYFDYIKTNIPGIDIGAVDISIPFKNKQLKMEASDFWMNNNCVTFKLKMKNRQADKMRPHLLKLGFDDIRTIQTEGYSELVIIKLKK